MTTLYNQQGIARPVIASKSTSRAGTEYEYSSVKAFAEMELGNANLRRTVARRCDDGGGSAHGWNVRYA
jgi:hypothetical protein